MKNNNLTIKRKTYKEIIIYNFLTNFINNLELNIPLNNLMIYTSQDLIFEDIFVRKETWEHNITTKKIKLFIDCIVDVKLKNELKDRYFHVTWAALTYYVRNVDKNILLRSLKDINDKKSKFCDFVFTNKGYRNGLKRWNFFNILNNLKKVERPKDNSRFSENMFNNAVELHKPYRFSIAFENDIVNGWVTEKIINSFLAGCIPIYDGTDDIYKYFNKCSFINAKDFESLEKLAEYVVKVDDDPELYQTYIKNSPTNIEKLQQLFWWDKIKLSNLNIDKIYPSHREIVWYSSEKNIGLLKIPKCAGTAIISELNMNKKLNISTLSNKNIITVIRNPIIRFISAYIEVTEPCNSYPGGRFRHNITKIWQGINIYNFLDKLQKDTSKSNIEKFLIYLDKIENHWFFYENHCIPQAYFLTDKNNNLHKNIKIFKLENIQKLEEYLGIKITKRNECESIILKDELKEYVYSNIDVKKKIEHLYSLDMMIWNSF
tara:strand:+ start:405 stop:1871 length:1467 start_codon:yes stop_codon:yes gene_type:complete